jgi:serine/threonine protein kinase
MNKYEIIGIVGEGAYGIVYKAKCKETGEFGKPLILTSVSCDKKVQRIGRRRDRQENNYA